MWFNILPGAIIISTCVGLPGFGLWWLHYLVLGNHYRRTLDSRWDRHIYQRDLRLNGDPYKLTGLETIDD
ncbi:NADH dehydrogenase [ubiquinone] 1 alpha subcomplex subunit 1 [Spodoptera frugiperda]|uniref:NADH dehydrogenase [ubiquinone] 1 alpha subcomplex subunit 1 n=1 Tax=Spodoptera frugiperda TaxID=7108 RepID=A0A9R0D6R1_SPOFR|nr:NADH dehydrogenase [ubiquinone] 1 alpha subcomplex subunit 1 [Spodoptera frugiperda]